MSLPAPRMTSIPLSLLCFLTGIFYLNFTARVIFSPLLPLLERELSLGHGEAGSLFLLLQLGYCAGLLGSGFVSSWLNHRRTILLSILTLGVVLLILSRSVSIAGMRVGLLLFGAAAGLYLPSGIATLTAEVRREHWGKAFAIHELAPNLGYISAPLLAEALLRLLPWRGVLTVPAALAILMGICFMMLGRGGEHRSELPRLTTVSQLVRDPSLWILASLFSVGVGLALGVYSMMPLFLVSEIGMERQLANAAGKNQPEEVDWRKTSTVVATRPWTTPKSRVSVPVIVRKTASAFRKPTRSTTRPEKKIATIPGIRDNPTMAFANCRSMPISLTRKSGIIMKQIPMRIARAAGTVRTPRQGSSLSNASARSGALM